MVKFTGHTITPDSALGGTQIQRSLRFNKPDRARLERVVSTTGNQKVWTWSCWFKRTQLGDSSYFLSSYGNNDGIAAIYFDGDDRINTYYDTPGNDPYGAVNERRYRDTTSWMHMVWQVDAINGTQKIWINGVEETLSSSYNPPNYAYTMNQSGQQNTIGGAAWYPVGTGSNMYLAEAHFSDGNKYTPSDFGYTDAHTGQWRPKNPNVIKSNITYGTNGFWLDFRDNTSTTTLGYDYSGNGNHWTLNNMSVAAGEDNDSFEDTPTNNFCTLNPLDAYGDGVSEEVRNGSLQAKNTSSSYRTTRSTVHVKTGKWYFEVKVIAAGSNFLVGVAGPDYVAGSGARRAYNINGQKYGQDGFGYSYGNTYTTNDVIGVAIDLVVGTLTFYKNGTSEGVAFTDLLTYLSGIGWTPIFNGNSSSHAAFNFGQRPFSHTPPTGHRALSGHNLATVDAAGVIRSQRFFETLIYDGNDSNDRNIEGLEFKPDLVWIKNRDSIDWHMWQDSVRGANKVLFSNRQEGEDTDNTNGHVNYFTSGGFNVTAGDSGNVNENNERYVAWCWKAGGTAVSNSDGTISSSVSANQEAGFSITAYGGNATSGATVGHGLGTVPQMVILKRRDSGGSNWYIYHHEMNGGSNDEDYYVELNSTSGKTSSTKMTNGTPPTSTVFSLSNDNDVNASSGTYIMYSWTEIPGYSKFGSYKGNGSTDGPYVHCGFAPRWFMTRRVDGGSNAYIWDTVRETNNLNNSPLQANDPGSEPANYDNYFDILSNGFKVRASNAGTNSNNDRYIFMAFADKPSGTMFGRDANAR